MNDLLARLTPTGHQPAWQLRHYTVTVRGEPRLLRLVRFERGWLASTDTESGPTLGADASPYLAAHRALEPIGFGLAGAMAAIGRVGPDRT